MRAISFMRFGGPEVLEMLELPKPTASSGEIVVRVVASTVNPTDALMRAGKQVHLMKGLQPPYIAGVEFAGYVDSTAENSSIRVGQAVMGTLNARRQAGGSHAQYLCLPAGYVAPMPSNLDFAEAATIPMNGLTAVLALEALNLRAGQVLLVTGGAGAVGSYAIELGRHAGLRVIADAKPSDEQFLRRIGAEVVPRGEEMAAAVRALCPDGVDGLIDTALLQERAAALVRTGGGAVPLRSSHPIRDPRLRVTPVSVTGQPPSTPALLKLSELAQQGVLTPRVAMRLPMEEAARAHALVEQGGLRGRVVLMFEEAAGR